MTAQLEELLERGEVEAALILCGPFTEQERKLAQQAFEAGLKIGKQLGAGERPQ